MHDFSKNWFIKYQKQLLWFANSWIGRKFFDISGQGSYLSDKRIVYILPDSLTATNSDGKLTTEFRSHPKYAKRLYFGFLPLWYTFHWFDMLFANRFAPQLNLGFDSTGDLFPAEGANAPWDGYAQRDLGAVGGDSFSDLRSGAGTDASALTGADRCASLDAGTSTDGFTRIQRGIFGFDTSVMGSGATVTAATLSFSPSFKNNGLGDTALAIVSATPGSNSNAASTDYGNLGTTSFGSIAYADWTADGGYDDAVLNSSGQSHISVTSYTFFGTRLEWDRSGTFSGTWSSALNTRFETILADFTGTSRDPKLVVTYTPGGGGAEPSLRMLMGMGT